MGKDLTELSLEELWKKFPIYLTEHQVCWKTWFEEESLQLCRIFKSENLCKISHIGSTAVNTIWAKPIVDILVEITEGCDMDSMKKKLTSFGWICMNESEHRKTFCKGYGEDGFGERVFHLHVRYEGDHDELYFRDYLMEKPQIAQAYEKLKLDLWEKHTLNRDKYTKCKTDFVHQYTEEAKVFYQYKYEV